MRNAALILAVAAIMAACTTPRQQCLAEAGAEVLRLEELVARTRANLARGYRETTVTEPVTYTVFCFGKSAWHLCQKTDIRTRRVTEPIDPDAERRKLALLERRLREARARAQEAEALCLERYPEG